MLFRCKWCGREYDSSRSTANRGSDYCSGKCEGEARLAELERKKAEAELGRTSGSSDSSGCGFRTFIICIIGYFIIAFIVYTCGGPDIKKKKKNDKDKTEQPEAYRVDSNCQWWQLC